ncbi:MAG: hypothetical protein Q8N99_08380 [Nanoarchaeota archaeon]|nr:hypothetical protein [Nanoarchaeota archaeon]
MDDIKEVGKLLLAKAIALGVFLLIILILNITVYIINNQVLNEVVVFLNHNIIIIILFILLFIAASVLETLVFPYNLPGPLLNAIGGWLLVYFIFDMFNVIKKFIFVPDEIPIKQIYYLTSIIVFIIILVIGYIKILADAGIHKYKKIFKDE